jgi:type IV secretory pathway VirB3-like protein
VKPKLIAGCERTPFMIIFITSLLLLVEGSFTVKIIGAIFFFVGVGIVALLNRYDPFFFKIIFNFLAEQEFYPASADHPSRPANPNNKDK